ncbi:glycosyltransferase family 87 protein [Nocardioides euryhalodurans]|uniref:glycosyltransferase family 87 protein n=1 Tax=Nocardioides euryhalodurans TaxID=2518370 RepID=UPI001FC9AD08|nr:glycosyltransferase 87 family protein [Nocardioides euryhalodurans]
MGALSEGVGGPVGEHAGRHPWWTPVRVLLVLTAVCFALGMVQKTSCYQDAWQDGEQRYAHMCYSDIPYLYTGRGLAELSWPYTGDEQVRARYEVMEYPAGITYWAWGTAWATHWLSGSPDLEPRYALPADALAGEADVQREATLYVVVNAAGLAALTLLAVWFLAGVHRRRPWDAAILAVSPALALTGLVNWDLLAVALVAGAAWAWARDRPVLTGVLIGLGAATKLYPLLLLGAVLVICLRERRLPVFARVLGAAVAAWLLANLPAMLTGWEQWLHFWRFNSERGADLGSLWLVLDQAAGTTTSPSTINLVSWLFLAAWCAGVLVLGLRAPVTPRFAQLAFLVVLGFLLVNKVYSPQYVLWLLPLAALARPRWRDQLVWLSGEVLYFAAVWWYLGGYLAPAGGGEAGFYWIAILLRVAAQLYLAGIVVRDVMHPAHDPVWEERQLTRTRSKPVAV